MVDFKSSFKKIYVNIIGLVISSILVYLFTNNRPIWFICILGIILIISIIILIIENKNKILEKHNITITIILILSVGLILSLTSTTIALYLTYQTKKELDNNLGEGQFAKTVIQAFSNGNADDYESVINNEEFINAFLMAREDLAGTINHTNDYTEIDRNQWELIKAWSREPLNNIDLVVVGEGLNRQPTKNCGQIFNHDEMHAILAIPLSVADDVAPWYRCYREGKWPRTHLKIEAEALRKSIKDTILVGVFRDSIDNFELRLSRKAAEELEIPNAENYAGALKSGGKVSIIKFFTSL